MKKTIKILVVVLLLCGSIMAGLSMINVNMVQHQKQSQNQITKQYNTQLTIVGINKKVENIVWKVKYFQFTEALEAFINHKLHLYQQLNMKITSQTGSYYTVVFPVINGTEINTYTNSQKQLQSQTNNIKFNLFDKIRNRVPKLVP